MWMKNKNQISRLLTEKHTTYKIQKENLSLQIQLQTDRDGDDHFPTTRMSVNRQTTAGSGEDMDAWTSHTRLEAMEKVRPLWKIVCSFLRS